MLETLASSFTPPSADDDNTLGALVDSVITADSELGRLNYSPGTTQVVKLPKPQIDNPQFRVVFPKGREERPVNSGEGHVSTDPLSLDTVKAIGQNYILLLIMSFRILLLANPYGYMPQCATWAAGDMIEQAEVSTTPGLWLKLLEVMLFVCRALGNAVIGFNGLAGNSLRRLHFVSHRPLAGMGPYALQQVAAKLDASALRSIGHIGPEHGYPIDAWRFGFERYSESASAAAAFIQEWEGLRGAYGTVSVAAAVENDKPVLYVIPRDRMLSAFGWPGMAAIMEIIGAGVTSRPEFITRVRNGDWGHDNYVRFIASLRPDGVECLRSFVC